MNNLQMPQVEGDLIATLGPMGWRQKLTILALFVVALWGWIAYACQARDGLAVTAMNDYSSWGIYIINSVFFLGISMAGTLISALLRLSGAHWRGPISRLAEAVTLNPMFWKITTGKGPMPTLEKLINEDDRWNVINYVRTLAPGDKK